MDLPDGLPVMVLGQVRVADVELKVGEIVVHLCVVRHGQEPWPDKDNPMQSWKIMKLRFIGRLAH